MNYHQAVVNMALMCSDVDAFERLLKAGLNEHLFVEGIDAEERKVFVFSEEWYRRDRKVPPRHVLKDEFTQFFTQVDFPEETDLQPEYIVKFLKNNAVKVRHQAITKEATERIFTPDADQVKELGNTFQELAELFVQVTSSTHTQTMEEAIPNTIATIFERAEAPDDYAANLVKFPFEPLNNEFVGLKPRELCVFFGYTGDMKSLTVEKASIENAQRGKRVAHFTYENGIEQTTNRFLAQLTGIPLRHIEEGILPPAERDMLREVRDGEYTQLPIMLDESPNPEERNVETLFTRARLFQADIVIIDQASWVEVPGAIGKALWEKQYQIIRKIQEHTNELGCVTFLASQANRESQKSKKGTTLAHIAGSDETTKTASFAVSLSKEKGTDILKCQVEKARRGKNGWGFTMRVDLDIQTSITPDQAYYPL